MKLIRLLKIIVREYGTKRDKTKQNIWRESFYGKFGMNCLDCETYETTLQSVSKIMGIPSDQLLNCLVNMDYYTLYNDNVHCHEVPFREFLFEKVCDYFYVHNFEINCICWFHLSRTMHPEWFAKKGILSLREIEPLLHDDIEKLRQQIGNPPKYTYKWPTYGMINESCRQGPFAMLIKDVAFHSDEMRNHDYLSIPEYIEDMGAEIADLFRKNSTSVIVKFKASPQYEAKEYLKVVIFYLYSIINKIELSVYCNTCYEAPLHRVPPEDIIYIKKVS